MPENINEDGIKSTAETMLNNLIYEPSSINWNNQYPSNWCSNLVLRWIKNSLRKNNCERTCAEENFRNIDGKALCSMDLQEFTKKDGKYGQILYEDLHMLLKNHSTTSPKEECSCQENLHEYESYYENDIETVNSSEINYLIERESNFQQYKKPIKNSIVRTASTRGRKPGQLSKGNHLWEFLRDLLHSSTSNPNLICWENQNKGIFRILKSEDVAQKWGEKKNRPKMTYEKMSRAMRFCREVGYFSQVPKDGNYPKKLVFRFGEKASGWQYPDSNTN